MRKLLCGILLGVVALGFAAGCKYKNPPLREWYGEVVIDMDRDDVVEILGEPTVVDENEMLYLYDDPEDPARFRFVLDEENIVVAKYYETKSELREKWVEVRGDLPETEPAAEGDREYPGGPLPRFERMKEERQGY